MRKTGILVLLLGLILPAMAYGEKALTLRAEQARIKTVGGITSGAWNLWSDGEWGDFLGFTKSGSYEARVWCYGSPASAEWPEMGFCVDGKVLETVVVATNKPAEFKFRFPATARSHRITVVFLNDATTATEDRNLYVLSLSVEPLDKEPAPALITEQDWHAEWSKEKERLEAETLAKAGQAIEKSRKGAVTLRVLNRDGHPMTGATLKVELIRHDFLFGGNIFKFDRFGTARENAIYKDRFRELFNYATTGFYWRSYEREKGKPDYDHTDRVVAWCGENHIRLKGHPLLWACEYGIPPWSRGMPSPVVQKQRVTEILNRYSGKIEFWEVVNEPAHCAGLDIAEPYRWAREADPKSSLVVNDYNVLNNGCPPFFKLLQRELRNGVPFDGIGIQAHEPRTKRFPLDEVWKTLDHYATLGKQLHITEFTPTSAGQPISGSHLTGLWDEAAQADYAVKFYTVCFAHPSVAAITWWDLCDAGSWLPGGGLLRKDLSPKPAYEALQRLIHEQWKTEVEGKTDSEGKLSFRGFFGQYSVTITRADQTFQKSFRLTAGGQKPITLVL